MRALLALAATAVFLFAVASCSAGPCGGASCGPGLYCNLVENRCLSLASDAGQDAGGTFDAGQTVDAGPACGGQCPITLPYCDAAANKCRRCLADAGCSGSTPVCDTGAYLGEGGCFACLRDRDCVDPLIRCHVAAPVNRCVQCTSPSDCVAGACDYNTFSCTDAG